MPFLCALLFFKMNMLENCAAGFSTITDYAKYKVCGVIPYILHEGHSAAEIHCPLVVVYGVDVMNR